MLDSTCSTCSGSDGLEAPTAASPEPTTKQEAEVSLRPVMLVDGDTVVAGAEKLKGATVTAKVLGEAKGEKIRGFTYKNKSNQRKRWGHRQHYSVIEITGISAG